MVDGLFELSSEPAFEHRSFMLDISRDRVPTAETLQWLIEVLATLRYTELQLYVEHTYAFAGHHEVWADASALTAEEMAAIATFARSAGIELTANLNTFGHMERWLRHPAYLQRAECPDGLPDPLSRLLPGPACLAPTPDNAEFAVALARDLVSAAGSNRVMIGGDEPFELGAGASADAVGLIGRDRVYRDHLVRIIEPLVADGKEVLFWGDQFRTDPAALDAVPTGATCVVWNYDAPDAKTSLVDALPGELVPLLGSPDDARLGFVSHARLALDSDVPTWVACGTSSWNTFLGRNQNAAANIDDAASVGATGGATGFMLADWGDNGHWQPLAASLPSMVRGAIAAWSGSGVDPAFDIGSIVDGLLDAPPGTGALIDQLGNIAETIGLTAFNGSAAFNALIPTGLPTGGELDSDGCAAALTLIDEARSLWAPHLDLESRWGIAAQELDAACRATALGLRRLVEHGGHPGTALLDDATPDAVHAEIGAVVEFQRAAWLRSSEVGGLEDSLARLRP